MSVEVAFDAAVSLPRAVDAIGVGVIRGRKGLRVAGRGHAKLDLAYLEARGFTAKPGEAQSMPAGSGRSLVAVGLGEAGNLDEEALRKAGAALVRTAKAPRVAMVMAGAVPHGLGAAGAAQAVVEGAALAAYEFHNYKSSGGPDGRVERMTLAGSPAGALAEGTRRGALLAEAVGYARDLVNEPAGSLGPVRFAELAIERTESRGLIIEVWDEQRIVEERLGGVVGVSAGSAQPPRFLHIAYRCNRAQGSPSRSGVALRSGPRTPSSGSAARQGTPFVALVGKGVTFDSGGLSLKAAGGMETMKTDMSGAAAVLAAMSVLAELDVAMPVAGYVPLVENMPGGRAARPGDVLRARNGKTIEVLNTDAEGRLILADALSLAAEDGPDAIVDLATLTGACSIALGDRIAGLMGNDDRLLSLVETASRRSGEAVWHLPLPEEYRKHIDSDVADVKNVGAPGGLAGTLTAGLFLAEFVGKSSWAHLDIAGPARSGTDEGYLRKGGTGFGVRTLVELLAAFPRRGLHR